MLKRLAVSIFAALALVAGGVAGAPNVAYADNDVVVGGVIVTSQTFNTSDASVNDEFEYCLEAQTAGAPMPVGAVGNKYCFTLKGNDEHSMQLLLNGAAPDVSKYTLRLVTPLTAGYTLTSDNSYTYEVYGQRKGTKYTVLVFDSAGKKEEDPSFALTYKPVHNPTDTPSVPTATPSTSSETSSGTPVAKPPTSTLVRTGASVSLGVMLVLLVSGSFFLLARREKE
ncbi:MAG: hypothetical protein IKZ87_00890 [Actinomycetaceae bacterium]|nr:hypothetical protein [Actinomycetaceae bacterium]